MENPAGLMIRLSTIRAEFGDAVYERASHAASIAIARYILEIAEQRAAEAPPPPRSATPPLLITGGEKMQ